MKKLLPIKPFRVFKKFNNWRDDVITWLEDWVVNGYSHKKKQLYLHGESNTGKSSFINHLMGKFF